MIKHYIGTNPDSVTKENEPAAVSPIRAYLYAPTDKEIEEISEKSNIPVSLLRLALDRNALSRIHQNHVTYAIFDIPLASGSTTNQQIKTNPVGIYFREGIFVVVSNTQFPLVVQTLEDPETMAISNEQLFLRIVYSNAVIYARKLSYIDKETEKLENQMKRRVRNTAIFQLMDYQRSLTAMTTSLRGLKRMLTRIKEKKFCTEDTDLLEDSIVAAEQAEEMAEIFNDDLNALMDGFGSVISNSVNQIMKILTALTLILSIPMVIAGLYGMNVRLPFENDYNAFWYVCGISGVIAIVTTIWFYIKKML